MSEASVDEGFADGASRVWASAHVEHIQNSTVVRDANGLPVVFEGGRPVSSPGPQGISLVVKRALDIALAGGALLFLGPLLLFVALLIKISDPGPVLFKQERTGKDGKSFFIYKFRTMHVHAGDHSGVQQTTHADPRVTRFGRFMRAKSIDELPQLLNVLKGDMSLVGPRPHVPGQLACGIPYEQFASYYPMRHVTRPGLTGWAQVNGFRGPTDTSAASQGRIDHDLAYIQNFSLALDLQIIVRTAVREITGGSGL